MEKKTSVINEGTPDRHTTLKWPWIALFWGNGQHLTEDAGHVLWGGQTAEASLRQNCSSWSRSWHRRLWNDGRGPVPAWVTSPLQLHQCVWFQFSAITLWNIKKNKTLKKKRETTENDYKRAELLNVCFKDSSSSFQVFGCFSLLCV